MNKAKEFFERGKALNKREREAYEAVVEMADSIGAAETIAYLKKYLAQKPPMTADDAEDEGKGFPY